MVATLVLRNADVITMQEETSMDGVRAIAVEGDRILAVGSENEIEPLIDPNTEVLSVAGKTVLPGFIDDHVHLTKTGLGAIGPSVHSISSTDHVLDVVADARSQRDKGQQILVLGCLIAELDRPLSRTSLDGMVPNNPIMISDVGGHSCVVNTEGWQSLQISPDTPGVQMDPDTGRPTGLLIGEANTRARFHFYSRIKDSTRIAALHRAANMAVREGITTVHALEGGTQDGHGWLPQRDAEVLLEEQGDLPVRAVLYFQTTDVEKILRWGLPRLGGDLWIDGSYGERTAALLEPYSDEPDNRGRLYFSHDELNSFIERAHRAGLQISHHAIGDAAIEQLLNAYERALRRHPRADHRHRIEHFSLPTSEHIERVAELGIALSMQPNFAAMPERAAEDQQIAALDFLGPERLKRRHPYRKIVDAGILVAGGSDSDCKPMGPLLGIHAVVNHPDEVRRLTVFEALTLYTVNGAKIAFEEEEKGTIEVGKLADVVVLSSNPLTMNPRKLKEIQVEMTIVGGDVVYDSRAAQR